MKACLSVLRIRAACETQYRSAMFSGMITQLFFGLLLIAVYRAFQIPTDPAAIAGTATYVWIQQAFFRMGIGGDYGLSNAIYTGSIAYELCRPLHPYAYWYTRDIAYRSVASFSRAALMLPIALLLPVGWGISAPASLPALLAALCALLMGVLIASASFQIIQAYTMRTLDFRGLSNVYSAMLVLFTGNLLPLTLFPESWQPVLRAVPFAQILDIPIRLYTGALPLSSLPGIFAMQLAWLATFVVVGLWAWNANLKRLVVQGG